MLENFAYLAGIIGTVATVWNLYYAWKNDRFSQFKPTSPKMDKILEEEISGEEKVKEIEEYVSSIDTLEQLKLAFRSTKNMHFATDLDDALKEIVKKACEINELNFAYTVASRAHFASALDAMLLRIVNAAIDRGDLKMAEKASNRMHFASNLDEAKRKIVNSIKTVK